MSSRARMRLGLLLALFIALGGCATAAEVTGTATQQDLMQLRADVAALQLVLQRAKSETDAANAQQFTSRKTRDILPVALHMCRTYLNS